MGCSTTSLHLTCTLKALLLPTKGRSKVIFLLYEFDTRNTFKSTSLIIRMLYLHQEYIRNTVRFYLRCEDFISVFEKARLFNTLPIPLNN
jgi:hypothetical protein